YRTKTSAMGFSGRSIRSMEIYYSCFLEVSTAGTGDVLAIRGQGIREGYRTILLQRPVVRRDEQLHSELKSDMNVESLPSGKFAVKALILKVALVAFNILRFLEQSVLGMEELPYKTEVTRKRLRKVIDHLIRVEVKLVFHARQQVIKLRGRDPCLRALYDSCSVL
ncbi:hypothetical protein SAMN05920897_106148, partial [Alkalispirochaeta americana]